MLNTRAAQEAKVKIINHNNQCVLITDNQLINKNLDLNIFYSTKIISLNISTVS